MSTLARFGRISRRGQCHFWWAYHQNCGKGLRRRSWLVSGAILAVLLVAGAAWWPLSSSTTVTYTSAPIARGSITRSVTATGTVNPELTIIVGTYVSGVIKELFCDYNTQVKKGQVCAKIDPRPYQTVVDQNKANLAVAKAQLEKDKAALTYMKLSYERAARLVQTEAVSQDVVDNAKSNYDQAQSQIVFDEATIQQREPFSMPRRSILIIRTLYPRWMAPLFRAPLRWDKRLQRAFRRLRFF